ncbi:hypothetical protein [Rhizobium leguminosarum]|jgi:hypothetical protein|nr:hypothetical protein [Rhizobium leguminosarum]
MFDDKNACLASGVLLHFPHGLRFVMADDRLPRLNRLTPVVEIVGEVA